MSGIDPRTRANKIDPTQAQDLCDLTVAQMRRGEKLNRIVVTDPAALGYKSDRAIPDDERLYAYKRQDAPCRVCSNPIEDLEVGGRKMWMCPTCQN